MQVRPCKLSTEEDKEKCKKALDYSKKAKKSRLTEQQEVRDAVDLDGAPDADEDTNIAEVEEVDAARGKTIRKIGPMDKFTMPLDQDSLSNTRVIRQQLITESIMKERMHSLQRYIARWVYVRGKFLPAYCHLLHYKF
jgi:hypothetical protein